MAEKDTPQSGEPMSEARGDMDEPKRSHALGYTLTAIIALVVGAAIGYGAAYLMQSGGEADPQSEPAAQMETESQQDSSGQTTVALNTSNLEALTTGTYEGWAVFGEEKVSLGTFKRGGSVMLSTQRDLSGADEIVVTVEPDPDPDPTPSGIVVLAGQMQGGAANLSFPVDLTTAAGTYILGTPTNGNGSMETSGIWFLQTGTPLTKSLTLPTLPENWVYEGWAVTQGGPLTSGRFTDVAAADDFDGYSGPQAGPPFPGEDYLTNAPSGYEFPAELADGNSRTVITVEPDINGEDPTGPKPFSIKLLAGDILEDAADHKSFDLALNADTIPSGTAQVR